MTLNLNVLRGPNILSSIQLYFNILNSTPGYRDFTITGWSFQEKINTTCCIKFTDDRGVCMCVRERDHTHVRHAIISLVL